MKITNNRMLIAIVCLLVLSFVSACSAPTANDTARVIIDEKMEDSATPDSENAEHRELEVLKFVTDDFKPYINKDGDDGLYLDLIREIYGRHDIEVSFDYVPWARGLEGVHNHEYFGTVPWSQNSERMRSDVYSNNLYATKSLVVYMKNNPLVKDDFNETLDLKKYNLGTIANYFYINELEALGFELDSADSEEEGLTKLYNGRYDAIIINELVLDALIDDLFPGKEDEFAVMTKPFRMNYHGIRIAGDYPNKAYYINLFNEELKKVIEDGTYNKITEKYGMPPVNKDEILKQYLYEPIVIGIEDYAPYEFVNEEGNIAGIGVETIKEALLRQGYSYSNIEIVVRPWARLMEMGNRGEIDMILDAFDTEERRQIYDYSEEVYGRYAFSFIGLKEAGISYENNKFSKPINTIGIVRGYAYGEDVFNLLEKLSITVHEVATTDELIEAMFQGRFDVIIEAEEFVKFYLKQHEVNKEIDILGEPLVYHNSYVIYPKSRKNEALREAIDEVVKNLNVDGTVEKIRNYYLE